MHTVRKLFSRFSLSARTKSSCGVDICGSSLRLLRVSAGGVGGIRLERYISLSLPQDAIINGRIRNYETLLPLIASAAERICSSSRASSLFRSRIPLTAALPRSLGTVETVWPSADSMTTEHFARQSAENPPDSSIIGFLSPAPDPLPSLLAKAGRADAEAYAEAFDSADWPLSCLDTEWTAYANAFRYWLAAGGEPLPPVCAWIIAEGTDWPGMVLADGQPVYLQELAAAAPVFSIAQPANSSSPSLSQIRNSQTDAAVQEILRFLQFYRTSPAAVHIGRIDCILLSGTDIPSEHVLSELSAECGLPVRRICPALLLSDDEAWQQEAAGFDLAFGLALHGAWQ